MSIYNNSFMNITATVNIGAHCCKEISNMSINNYKGTVTLGTNTLGTKCCYTGSNMSIYNSGIIKLGDNCC